GEAEDTEQRFTRAAVFVLPQPSASCLSRQQLLAAIRQMQQLLKGQETRFSEGLRAMRSRIKPPNTSPFRGLAASCPALQAPADGRKFGTKYLVDHEVHFTCDPGFQLLGSSTRMCQANGSWTGQEPRCAGTISECSSSPCQNGGTCLEGLNHFKCLCPAQWTGTACQYQAQTAPPTWSVTDDPAFSRQPRCAQIAQTQQCSCDPGFHMSGTASNGICQDLNECEVYRREGGPRLCAHACVNVPGSFRCSCPTGYILLGDGKSCEDIDECSLSQDNCTSGSTCINTGGGFQCVTPQCPPAAGNISYVKTSPLGPGSSTWMWTCLSTWIGCSRPSTCPKSPSLSRPMSFRGGSCSLLSSPRLPVKFQAGAVPQPASLPTVLRFFPGGFTPALVHPKEVEKKREALSSSWL
uniref:Fibulin 7 n=1 Tax=Malurus cyaneus samueli TaxID=2593467 RepID=A0A8C5X9R7_9PASS